MALTPASSRGSGSESGGFTGWTQDASNPANVSTHDGSLDLAGGSLIMNGDGNIEAGFATVTAGVIEFTGFSPNTVPAVAITGSLSTVLDAAAKAVLTSTIAGLVALGLVVDNTT